MEKWKRRSLELVSSLLLGGKRDLSVLPYYPQKTEISTFEEKHFKRTAPEKKGISSRRIYNMLCELEGERRANVHSLLVLRGGEVICECSAKGYSVNEWHASHSMAKTVCGMVIGRLIDDGKLELDMRIVDIFPEIPYRDKKFPLISVAHLLSMTSGVDFAEAGAITESEWTAAFFLSAVKFAPGTKFSYNSMNSYLLARVAERVSGKTFIELANDYIFAPLGIKSFLWEKSPENTEKGGWGLYMSAESWAKLGLMLLNGGVFCGRRVLSEKWVALSTTVKAISPESNGNFNYSYHTWVGRDNGEILFNGMLGQNVWICPKNNIVAVVTSGNNEMFQDSPALEIIRKYLGGRLNDSVDYGNIKLLLDKQKHFFDCRRWVYPLEQRRGLAYLLGLKPKYAFDRAWTKILGSFAITDNNSSIMPLILRVMQNNLSTSIEEITFYRSGENLVLEIKEGEWQIVINVGLYGYAENRVSIAGEKYLIRALGEAGRDSRGRAEYKIELIFPETSNTRMIVIRKIGDGRLSFEFSERPNHRLAQSLLQKYGVGGGVVSFAYSMLERRLGKREIERILESRFSPEILGISKTLPDYRSILEKENEKGRTQSSTVKLIRTIVNRVFGEKME